MASRRKQEISEETQRRLIVAATDLAAEGGSAAMSIQAVATRSGISRGSVSWHFGSKDGLLQAVVKESFRWGMDFLRARLEAAPEPGVQALIEANFVMMSQPEARIFSTILLEAMHPDSTIRAAYAESYATLRRFYATYLQSVTAIADYEAAAVALLAGTLGINIQHRLDPERVDRRAAVTTLESIYGRGLEDSKQSYNRE
ncbi:TetR/AcrR family transcriptional regulator [Rhodococcus sp. MSC1_016]|jgi:TetR/AcrR family acrAB operon transcriptional repressor|uniref:TetR/AcrR family transcriptional regulator n=1 Tax=Rhodococcus sp. MSC1_016 TaxID=2909266 RepID=UPI00202DDF8F|nr:TetR/AcrR family transcriptional regulator [Rhodococcus sp. MSC1_016]